MAISRKSNDMSSKSLGADDVAPFFKFPMTMGGVFVGAFVRAFAIAKLWGWYVAPMFSLPRLPLAYAWGIGLLVSLMTFQKSKPKDEGFWWGVISAVLINLFAVFLGWVGTYFLP